MNRAAICQRIERTGVVPVIRAATAEQAFFACRALRAGGVDVLEVTMTVPDAIRVIHQLAQELAGHVLVGAGTVLDSETARACLEAGAEFIVSPGLDPEIVRVTHQANKPVLPGALTPTEIMAAIRADADIVKLFPASALGGAKYLRALRAPFETVRFLPTGGVNASTARDFIAAGAVALGAGSELVDAQALARGDHELIASRARALVNAVRVARSELGARQLESHEPTEKSQ